jgi:hypothetical protein
MLEQVKEEYRPLPYPRYIVVEDGKKLLLLKLVGEDVPPEYVTHAPSKLELLDAILNSMCANVYQEVPRRMYPEPKESEPEEEPKAEAVPTPGTVFDDFCHIHQRKKHKDGNASGGKGKPRRRKYACPDCKTKRPPVGKSAQDAEAAPDPKRTAPMRTHDAKGKLPECYLDYCVEHKRTKSQNTINSRGRTYRCAVCVREHRGKPRGGRRKSSGDGFTVARKAALALKLKDNPTCETCKEPLRRGKTFEKRDGTTAQYWKCINKCRVTGHEGERKRNRVPDDFEEIPPIVEKAVAKMNGYHPQDMPDIVQEISIAIWRGYLKFDDLKNKEVIRRYIKDGAKLTVDKFKSDELDAPVSEEDERAAREGFA